MRYPDLAGIGLIALLVVTAVHGQTFTASNSKLSGQIEWKSGTRAPEPIQRTSAKTESPTATKPEAPKIRPATLAPPTPASESFTGVKPLPINLATAMQLANARPLDIQIAARQMQMAAAQFDRAKWQWVPSLTGGANYFHHDGAVQNFAAETVVNSRTSLLLGGSLNAVFGLNDAIFGPLAARQDLNARRANLQAVSNDIALMVAEAYFGVQQARGELAGAIAYVKEGEELVRRTTQLAEGLSLPMETARARVELARRQQTVAALKERWRTASAELLRLLRLDPSAVIEPVEPESLTIQLIDPQISEDDLIVMGLTSRPELAAHQSLVQATLQRLRQEKMRPLLPSVLIRGASTNPGGTLGYGAFASGQGGNIGSFHSRLDYDVQVLWELQNFGLGNKARIDEKRAERDVATLELFRVQDRVAAEVVQARAQVRSATERLAVAEPALKDALDLLKKNMEALTQTRRIGNVLVLVVRPQEVVAALQALAQANTDYHAAVADFNRAQFRLFRALGHPAQCLLNQPEK